MVKVKFGWWSSGQDRNPLTVKWSKSFPDRVFPAQYYAGRTAGAAQHPCAASMHMHGMLIGSKPSASDKKTTVLLYIQSSNVYLKFSILCGVSYYF